MLKATPEESVHIRGCKTCTANKPYELPEGGGRAEAALLHREGCGAHRPHCGVGRCYCARCDTKTCTGSAAACAHDSKHQDQQVLHALQHRLVPGRRCHTPRGVREDHKEGLERLQRMKGAC